MMGKWEPLVSVDLWESVQVILESKGRVINQVGTRRRHFGSGLYLCGLYDDPVRGASRGYRCKHGRINRTVPASTTSSARSSRSGSPSPTLCARCRPPTRRGWPGCSPRSTSTGPRIKRAENEYVEGFLEALALIHR